MKYLLDTNICILLLGGNVPRLRDRVERCDEGELGMSAIVFAELAMGSWQGKLPPLPVVEAFSRWAPVLPFDELSARLYAQLPFRRGSFDRLIAAHALSLDLTLITNNERDFADIPNLRIENWTL
jgi:tRNA(fMet)-specific endonuclease VapC